MSPQQLGGNDTCGPGVHTSWSCLLLHVQQLLLALWLLFDSVTGEKCWHVAFHQSASHLLNVTQKALAERGFLQLWGHAGWYCSVLWRDSFPWLDRQLRPCLINSSTSLPQYEHWCGSPRGAPTLKPTAILMVSSLILSPRKESGGAFSQATCYYNRPGRPTDRLSAAIDWLKRGIFRKTASSRRYRISVAAVLAHRSAILLALASTWAYIHSRDIALDHVVFLYGLCHCVRPWFGASLYSARAYLHHWTLSSTTCNGSPEGRHDPI